jgi:hypothetical protein
MLMPNVILFIHQEAGTGTGSRAACGC